MAAHEASARAGAPVRQMIGFRLGSEKFAIDISKIHEIVKPQPITMVPDIPAGFAGMIHLRDQVVLMADLHHRFGLPPYAEGKDGRIIVLQRDDQPVGILVDAVSEVVRLQPHMIAPSPRFYDGITVDFIEAVGKFNGELLTILDTDTLFATPPTVEIPPLADILADTHALAAGDAEPENEAAAAEAPLEQEDFPAVSGEGEMDPVEALSTIEGGAEPGNPPAGTDSEAEPGEWLDASGEDAQLPAGPDTEPVPAPPMQEETMKKTDKAALHDELYQDIGHLARYINRAHQSFNQEIEEDDDPIRTKAKDLPTANDILQQVTLDTEAATMRIISGVEETNNTLGTLHGMLEELEDALPASAKDRDKVCDIAGRIREEMTSIETLQDETLVTLSFQDLTGQKIRQVIRLMMEVEERILALVVKYGINLAEDAEHAVEEKIDSLRAKPDPILRQDKVDDLLAEFGF